MFVVASEGRLECTMFQPKEQVSVAWNEATSRELWSDSGSYGGAGLGAMEVLGLGFRV